MNIYFLWSYLSRRFNPPSCVVLKLDITSYALGSYKYIQYLLRYFSPKTLFSGFTSKRPSKMSIKKCKLAKMFCPPVVVTTYANALVVV